MVDHWYNQKLAELKNPTNQSDLLVTSVAEKLDHTCLVTDTVLEVKNRWSLLLDTLSKDNSLETLRHVLSDEANTLLWEQGVALHPDSEEKQILLNLMATRALKMAEKSITACTYSSDIPAEEDNAQPATPKSSPTLSQLWARYEKHYGSSTNPSQRRRVENYRGEFAKLINHTDDCQLSLLDRKHARSYRDALRETSDTTVKGFEELAGMTAKKFRKLSLSDQGKLASDRGLPVRSASGVRGTLKKTSAVLNFAVREGYIRENILSPLPDVPDSQSLTKAEAFEYSRTEIRTLFTADAILSQLAVDELWFILVLYYTGARGNEIAPMVGADVVTAADGVECLDIRPDHAKGRTVKNKSSIRTVPIHPHLKALGFLEYARREDDKPLFPSLNDMTGYRVNSFARKLKACGVEQGIKATVKPQHGFRHHVVGLWRSAGKREDLQDIWLGHAPRSTQAKYGGYKALLVTALGVWPQLPDEEKLRSYLGSR
jgi:integrase